MHGIEKFCSNFFQSDKPMENPVVNNALPATPGDAPGNKEQQMGLAQKYDAHSPKNLIYEMKWV